MRPDTKRKSLSTPRSPRLSRALPGPPWRRLALLLASVGIGALAWWLLETGALPVLPPVEALSRVGLLPLVVFSALWWAALAFKCLRWHWQLAPIAVVPLRRVLSVGLIGVAAVALFPFRSGEFVRPVLISRGSSVPFLAAMTTSMAERVLDGVFASLLLLVSLAGAAIIDPLPTRIGELPVPAAVVPTLGYTASLLTLSATALILAFFFFRQPTIRLVKLVVGSFSERLALVVAAKLEELTQGLQFLGSWRTALPFLASTTLHWLMHLFALWYLFRHAGFPGLTLAQAGVVLGTLAFGAGLPNAPGLFGIFQMAVFASLALFFLPIVVQGAGAVATFWLYVLEMGWCFSLALVALAFEQRYSRHPQVSTSS